MATPPIYESKNKKALRRIRGMSKEVVGGGVIGRLRN
jgi:hypothetical protein